MKNDEITIGELWNKPSHELSAIFRKAAELLTLPCNSTTDRAHIQATMDHVRRVQKSRPRNG